MYDYLCRHGYVNEHNAKMIQLGLNRVKSFLFDLAYTVIIGGLLQIPFEALCMELSLLHCGAIPGDFMHQHRRNVSIIRLSGPWQD